MKNKQTDPSKKVLQHLFVLYLYVPESIEKFQILIGLHADHVICSLFEITLE